MHNTFSPLSCSQMLTDWSKTFQSSFEAYFLIKVHGILMHDYWNENASNYISLFYVSILELRFSADRFSRMPLFRRFSLKIDSNAHFDSDFSTIWRFSRKTMHAVKFYIAKIRIPIKFMNLRSKLKWELCQKVGSVEKTKLNPAQGAHFAIFFWKKEKKKKTAVFTEKR